MTDHEAEREAWAKYRADPTPENRAAWEQAAKKLITIKEQEKK